LTSWAASGMRCISGSNRDRRPDRPGWRGSWLAVGLRTPTCGMWPTPLPFPHRKGRAWRVGGGQKAFWASARGTRLRQTPMASQAARGPISGASSWAIVIYMASVYTPEIPNPAEVPITVLFR
jgi:hypothetical protein